MKLIDNRYRVDEILEDSLYSSLYRVTDFGMMIKSCL